MLELVGFPAEQRLPHGALDEQQDIEQLYLALAALLPHHEEVRYPVADLCADFRQSKYIGEETCLGNRSVGVLKV